MMQLVQLRALVEWIFWKAFTTVTTSSRSCIVRHEACRHEQLAVVEWEISHKQSHEGDRRFEVTLSWGVLDDAASNGHLQIAKHLYDRYDCNLPVTMLLAAANVHLQVVEWLYNKFGDQRMLHSRKVGDLAVNSDILNNP